MLSISGPDHPHHRINSLKSPCSTGWLCQYRRSTTDMAGMRPRQFGPAMGATPGSWPWRGLVSAHMEMGRVSEGMMR